MIRGNDADYDRLYEPKHIKVVLEDMRSCFPKYFKKFAPNQYRLCQAMKDGIETFEKEQEKYLKLLDKSYLEEFEYDPGAFKNTLKKDCPIIRRCLNSPAKIMDAYRESFYQSKSEDLLQVTSNVSKFARKFIKNFDANQQLKTKSPEDLGVSDLDTEPFTAYGVIGGGIRSHFLYNLHPNAFPNRSQNSVWAYYFLTNRKNYGYEDDSEFLMINSDGSGTQQNYFYPYDLFTFYAIKLFLMLKEYCQQFDYQLETEYRYVYLDTFLDHVAEMHQADITMLKPPYEQLDY